MQIINRIKRKLGSIANDPCVENNGRVRQEFGLFTGLVLLTLNTVDMVTSYKTAFYKNYLLKIIKKDVQITVDKYKKNASVIDSKIESDTKIPVWVIWWQDIKNAPQIVQECIASQRLYVDNNCYEYHLLNSETVWKYVELPQEIIEKFNRKEIGFAHFSDILRLALIKKYGGVWMDATIFMTSQLPENIKTIPFYSNKKKADGYNQRKLISEGKWTTYFFKAEPGDIIVSFVLDALIEYWRKHSVAVDYFLFDYLISVAYGEFPRAKKEIDLVPENNPEIFSLFVERNQRYTSDFFEKITKDTVIHKQSYKFFYSKQDKDGFVTNWGHACERIK